MSVPIKYSANRQRRNEYTPPPPTKFVIGQTVRRKSDKAKFVIQAITERGLEFRGAAGHFDSKYFEPIT
jgi:hypothetical protein